MAIFEPGSWVWCPDAEVGWYAAEVVGTPLVVGAEGEVRTHNGDLKVLSAEMTKGLLANGLDGHSVPPPSDLIRVCHRRRYACVSCRQPCIAASPAITCACATLPFDCANANASSPLVCSLAEHLADVA